MRVNVQERLVMLRRLKNVLKKIAGIQSPGLAGLSTADRELISRIRAKHLTYLTDRKLKSLLETCRSIENTKLTGVFVEAGCALGGSTILISSVKAKARPFFVYDVFEMIPAPTKEDTPDVHERYRTIIAGKSRGINGDKYYGYEANLYQVVQSNLESFGIDCGDRNIFLIKGLLQDTMKIDQPVAFAHVDVDWYEPVKACLERIYPKLAIGGSVILDDYHDWGGCRKATDEYLRSVPGEFRLDDSAGSMKITRVRN
jgi:hypothetical protein